MSAETLNRVHRRYIHLSSAFKSAWTFQQFMQGLQKAFAGEVPAVEPADFQEAYTRLRGVSQNLNEAQAESVENQLTWVEENLQQRTEAMLDADRQISPRHLRRFFERLKSYDDNVLTQLVKFYLYFRQEEGVESSNGHGGSAGEAGGERSTVFSDDRFDKLDFLVTKLCQEQDDNGDRYIPREPQHVREAAEGFWAILERRGASADAVGGIRERLALLRQEMERVDSIDHLQDNDLVARYRRLKREAGIYYFYPKICQEMVETNLQLKNMVRQLYPREEQRIVAEYQEVFELEREVPVDVDLRLRLADFQRSVELFEDQLKKDDLRLNDLASLRQQVRQLVPRMRPQELDATGAMPIPKEARDYLEDQSEELPVPSNPQAVNPVGYTDYEHVQEDYVELTTLLEGTSPVADPRKVILLPEIFSFRLEPREVIAFRRRYGDVPCDRQLEEFILRAAALRRRNEKQVETIQGLLDDSASVREGPIFIEGRQLTRMGDLFVHRFEHLIEQLILAGDVEEARSLQVLRVRCMRSFTGLWLLVHRSY